MKGNKLTTAIIADIAIALKDFVNSIESIKSEFCTLQKEYQMKPKPLEDPFGEAFNISSEYLHYIDKYLFKGLNEHHAFPAVSYAELAGSCRSAILKGNKDEFKYALDQYAGACCKIFLFNL